MRRFILVLCVAIAASACSSSPKATIPEGFNPEEFNVRTLVECTPRGGAPNFYQKLESGAPELKVAYFGGSITAQNGWRVYSREYFQSLYPDTQVKEINAAIGGTATDLGVFRCWHDVIKEKPDLVFIEFACNDSGTKPLPLRMNLEGIIRQIWKASPSTDIVFVYVVTYREKEEILAGKMQRSSSIMEDLADYYDIPSINFGASLAPLLEAGTLVLKSETGPLTRVSGEELNVKAQAVCNTDGSLPVNADGIIPFSGDGVHPYENTGHVLYETAIERSMPVIKAAATRARAHKMPAPMVAECLSEVATVSFEDPRITVSGEWQKDAADAPVTSPFRNRCDDFFTFEPGSEISFRFRGSAAAIYDLLGPQSSTIMVSVDGAEPKPYNRFDGYCTYHRLALMNLCTGLDPQTVHTVSVKVSPEAPDKREILFESNRGDYDGNPAKYAPLHYFAGCIFVVGEIVD